VKLSIVNENVSILQLVTNLKDYCKIVNTISELKNETYKSTFLENITSSQGRQSTVKCEIPLGMELKNNEDELFFFTKKAEYFNLNYPCSQSYIAAFPNCQLVSKSFIVISNSNHVIRDSYLNDEILLKTNLFLQQFLILNLEGNKINIPFIIYKNSPEKFIDKKLFLFAFHWHFNYHHWILDCIPRLRFILESDEFNDCLIVVPQEMNQFQKDTLEILGIEKERLFYFDGEASTIQKLYFPVISGFSHEETSWVRDLFLKRLNLFPKAEKLYYVSRADATIRRLINENEVIDFLKAKGFEILTLTGMPLQEQIEIFSRAKIVIGPHGAGLTNVIFSAKENILVELMPNDEVNQCYWVLANSLKQKYTYVVGENTFEERNFTISIPKLEKILESIL
jgi:hypothetical protein